MQNQVHRLTLLVGSKDPLERAGCLAYEVSCSIKTFGTIYSMTIRELSRVRVAAHMCVCSCSDRAGMVPEMSPALRELWHV